MACNFFQNNVVDLNAMWYESHKILIKRIAAELGCSDRQDELVLKFIGTPLKIKKQKDPLLPKKPKTSFLHFCDEQRPNIRENHPELKMGGVMKELGKLWSNCDNKEKYEKMASESKIEYEESIDTYNMNNCYD